MTHSVDTRKEQTHVENGQIRRNTVTAPRQARQIFRCNSPSRHLTNLVLHEDTTQRPKEKTNARSKDQEIKGSEETPAAVDPSTRYAKKARHKTKEDKYEYTGEVQAKKNWRNYRKRKRSGSVGKENFHAEKIDAKRVTLRPRGEQFVFSRSKMSMPLAGHDLPDLTFTKMDFLSRPRSSTHGESTQTNFKQDRKSDKARKSRKTGVQPDTAARHVQTRSRSTESGPCSEEIPQPISRGVTVQAPQPDATTIGSHPPVARNLSWLRSKVDSRLEEYQPERPGTKPSIPVSWSASPVTESSTQAVSVSRQAETVTTIRKQTVPTSAHSHIGVRSVSPLSSASNELCDNLTQRLLRRHGIPHTKSSYQDELERYFSLKDLIFMLNKMPECRSSDDLPRRSSNRLDNRPHIGLRGPTEAYIAHGSSPLYTDDTSQQQEYQTHPSVQSVRQHSAQERHVSAHYNGEVVLSDHCTSYSPYRKSYTVSHTEAIEPIRSTVKFGRSDEQPNPTVQQVASSPRPYETTGVRQGWDSLNSTAYFGWKATQELDDFDLDLLETAKMETIPKTFPSNVDLRHPNRESSAWLSQYDQPADLALRRSPPIFSTTEERYKTPLLRTMRGSQKYVEDQRPTFDRSTSQHQFDQAEFNPFRNSWLWLE